jgi:hypothetical protein
VARRASSPRLAKRWSRIWSTCSSRLRLWTHPNHGGHANLPENILVYRDGVSKGQHQLVLNEEVPLLRLACQEMYPPADQSKGLPRLTVVVVGKRHHTRFYASREGDADRSSNLKPATVADCGVTEARTGIFLAVSCSHSGHSAAGALLDEIFSARYAKTVPPPFRNLADVLEALTQSMCYTYGRATKAVSVCTPAYYADVVCERARCVGGAEPVGGGECWCGAVLAAPPPGLARPIALGLDANRNQPVDQRAIVRRADRLRPGGCE